MKILCHVGPNCKNLFKHILNGFYDKAEVLFLSGYKESDESNFPHSYYNLVTQYNITNVHVCVSDEDKDIIERCRLLRSLDFKIAHRHVIATRICINGILDNFNPAFIFSESVDQFLTDILRSEAKKRDIPFIGLIRTFVNGYVRISARGEHNIIRKPSSIEIDEVLRDLSSNNYLPSNLKSIKANLISRYLTIWAKNLFKIPYFQTLRLFNRNKYNYHFWGTMVVTKKYYFHLFPIFNLGSIKWELSLKKSKKKIIFIPLQHVPEATIDYWCDEVSPINYTSFLFRLLEKLGDDFQILVKEHPGVLGFRKPSFYSDLRKMQNVIVCPTEVQAQECINVSDAVLIWTGSLGFESLLRGKPVLALSTPYYTNGTGMLKIDLETKLSEIIKYIDDGKQYIITREDQNKFVEYLLSGLFKGTFKNDGSFDNDSIEDTADAMHLGKVMAKYLLK